MLAYLSDRKAKMDIIYSVLATVIFGFCLISEIYMPIIKLNVGLFKNKNNYKTIY
jgi:hypothetical protein